MYEFRGWVSIVSGDSDAEPAVLQMRRNDLVAVLEARLEPLRESPFVFARIVHDLNGADHLLVSGLRNHRDDRVLDLFRGIAEHQPYSYGLLHVRDDEDADGYDNAFVVHAVARAVLTSGVEPKLSPCIPILEARHSGGNEDPSGGPPAG